jgi:membrane-bound serine protease (ClpP class)
MPLLDSIHVSWPSRRVRLAFIATLLLAGLAVSCTRSIDQRGAVHVLTADSDVNPNMARYIDRGIDTAEDTDARAVVIKLDTPGGLSSSMEDIVQRIESSDVPVIVWVAPSGGKAASAGTFITMSGDVAVMAPGTRIGAAHPVGVGGGDIDGTIGEKVENDAAAYARSIAAKHGRNVSWAEDAVRDSVSASTDEAVDQHIVDFAASDIDALLRQSEGRSVDVDGRQVVLSGLVTAPQVSNDMTFFERVLLLLSDPNLALLFLSLGGLGLLIELLHPGIFAPGVFGVIMLILAFLALGTMPVNWAGVALIGLAFVLFAAEIFVAGFGALGIGGAVSFIIGGLILTSGNDASFQINRWLVIGLGVTIAIGFGALATAILRTRRLPHDVGTKALVGMKATARSYLNPDGFIFVKGERWKAVAEDGPIKEGERVEVTGARGLTLTVRRALTDATA